MAPKGARAFLSELTRRKVVRVLAGYLVVAWLVIQVVETTWEAIGLPPGTLTVVIVFAVAGVPVVGLLAWMYEVVPDPGAEPAQASGGVLAGVAGAAGLRTGSADRSEEERTTHSGEVRIARPLPRPATPFIGREAELRDLRRMLSDPGRRLVTVTGPGGVGKTRLAVQAAQEPPLELPHGVAYAPLSGLSAAELLPAALAEALGMTLSRHGDAAPELVDFLRAKRLLLVLDNFEHLTEGAGLLSSILEQAPDTRLLVTSRERLGLQAESVLPLDGLTLSVGAGGEDSEAVRFFVAAAQRTDPRFALDDDSRRCVVRTCEMLNGVPLALELAASWVRTLSCAEILADLSRGLDILSTTAPDVPKRHHSLRATFDSSWHLLSPEERRALARTSVFRTAFHKDAAAEIAGADSELLRALVDKSLLNRAGGRFLMLDVVRQYGEERLREDARAEAQTKGRHASYFCDVLGALESGLRRSEPEALARAATVLDEIRAAWAYAAESGDGKAILRASASLFHFYEARGLAREGADAFGRAAAALARRRTIEDAGLRALVGARLEVRQAVFLDRLGEHQEAEDLLRRGHARLLQQGDNAEIVFALNKLGAHYLTIGAHEEAEKAHREAQSIAEASGVRYDVGWCFLYLGNVARARGQYDAATGYYHRALELLREEGDHHGVWNALNNLGVIAGEQQRWEEAQGRFSEALRLQMELGNQRSTALLHHNLGYLASRAGRLAEARDHLEEAIAISEEMAYRPVLAMALCALAGVHLRDGDLTRARGVVQRALRTAAEAQNYPYILEALLAVARLRLTDGDRQGATELARIVASHQASGQDRRAEAQVLLTELAAAEPDAAGQEPPDLDELAARILAESERRVTV